MNTRPKKPQNNEIIYYYFKKKGGEGNEKKIEETSLTISVGVESENGGDNAISKMRKMPSPTSDLSLDKRPEYSFPSTLSVLCIGFSEFSSDFIFCAFFFLEDTPGTVPQKRSNRSNKVTTSS